MTEYCETERANGCFIRFERVIADDGGELVAVKAKASCLIAKRGIGVALELESPGIHGVDSSAGDGYLNALYEVEKSLLCDLIGAFENMEQV